MTWVWKFMQFVMQKMQSWNILAWICGNLPKFELFFSCTENFSKTKSPKKCFYSIIAQKNLNANFWKHVILIKSQVFFSSYGHKLTRLFINITCFQKLALRFFWAIIEEKHFFGHFVLLKFSVQEKKAQIFGKFPHIQAKIFQDCIFCITNCMNFHTHVIV